MASVRLRPYRKYLVAAGCAAGLALIFVVAGEGSRRLFERPQDNKAPRPMRAQRVLIPPEDPERFRVTGVQGSVECVQEGRTYVLQAGDLLSLQDVVRTAPASRVLLRRGGSEIEMRENLEIRVEALAAQAAKFSVIAGDGDMAANVERDDETVAIAADSTLAVNVGASRWIVARSEGGKVAVAVSRGNVQFEGHGGKVMLTPGTESVAGPGTPPTDPRSFPDDLLLSVIWPEAPAPNNTTAIRGTARPSSRVMINGRVVQVNADGTFAADIPLQVGRNKVQVQARDLQGRQKRIDGTIRREAHAPALESKPENLWAP